MHDHDALDATEIKCPSTLLSSNVNRCSRPESLVKICHGPVTSNNRTFQSQSEFSITDTQRALRFRNLTHFPNCTKHFPVLYVQRC